MVRNFNGFIQPAKRIASRHLRAQRPTAGLLALVSSCVTLVAAPKPALSLKRPNMTSLQGLVSWPWSGWIHWRDDPAQAHRAWSMGADLALQSMRSGYEALTLDEGIGESMSRRAPTMCLGWVGLSGPLSRRLSATIGWYRTDQGLVQYQTEGLAQRFLFQRALRTNDVVVWNLSVTLGARLLVGLGLGFERMAMDQSMTLWPGDSRSRPTADTTFDLPVHLNLSGYRARLGLGLGWSGPTWLTILAAAELLTPIRMTGRFVASPPKPSVNLALKASQGSASLERGLAIRSRIGLTAEPPYAIVALGAGMEGPGYRRNMISIDDIVVTSPTGSGLLTELPAAWQPKAWTWSVHTTVGARLDRWGLRILGGFSATSPNRSLCGRLSEKPDFRAGFSLLVRMGSAMLAASYGRQWTETTCDHRFPAAFNPSAGPTRAASERGRTMTTDIAAFTMITTMP